VLSRADGLRLSTQLLGGPEAGVWFVQHGQYAAQAERLLGPSIVTENYPMDHTHTMPYLADVVSPPFISDSGWSVRWQSLSKVCLTAVLITGQGISSTFSPYFFTLADNQTVQPGICIGPQMRVISTC
jgi:hypothetical protein